MDSTDDDFGELYVDDKVQAFAGDVGGFVKSCEEPKCAPISDENKCFEGTEEPESRAETKKLGVVVAKDSSPSVDAACAVNRTGATEESEDSDSEDDLNIVLKEDGSKVLHGSNTNNGGAYVEPSQTCSFQKRKTGNWSTMPNSGMTMEALANNAWMNPYLGMPQSGYNIWSRTTFDANFDEFEKKPWRDPGTDISDFFNFGFNEQSWKEYCDPLGRAIEVEDGTLGRIPSVDLRHPRDSDPDVVIQIPVTNDVKELASVTPVEASSLGITSNKASTSEEFHSDNGNDLNSSGDSVKEEASVGCEDENTGSFRDEQFSPKENRCIREVTPCDKEIIEEEKEETCWNSDKADSTSVERESSPGDHFRVSPASSYSVGKTEDSETESSKGDTTDDDQREVSTPPRRTRFAENEANNIKSGEQSGTKHSRHRRSHEEPNKRHCGRADYGVHRRTKHGLVKDPDLGERVCSRRGSLYRDSSRNWQNGPPFTIEKVQTEGKGNPHSNREKRYGPSYSSVHLDRDRGEHMVGWRNNKEPSHGRGFDHFNGYKYEARLREYTSGSSFNLNQRNSRLCFNEDEDRYGRQHCERNYGRERSPDLAYESNKERNRYDWPREPYHQDHVPITDMDSRYRFECSSALGRHNPKQSRENDLHFRRRGDYDYNFYRHHRYEDGIHRAESGIPFELAYRETHSLAVMGRREYEGFEKNEEFSEIDRRHHYTRDWHLDRYVSEKDGYQYRIEDAWPSPSLSLRDAWSTKGSRGDSWRDDTRDFTTTEAYASQRNQLYKDAPRDGWTRDLVHSNNVRMQDRLRYDDDDRVRRDRSRYQLGDDIQCSMREVTHSEHLPYTDEMLSRDIRMSTKQGPGYLKRQIHENDERHHISKKLRRDGHAFIKCKDPVDLIGRQGKRSKQSRRRFSNGRDPMEQQERQKPGNVTGRKKEKAGVEIQGLDEKEEGEITEEARNVKGIEIGEEQIRESLKKMEKRRERFKKTEFSKTVEATIQSQTKPGAKTDDTNQERPVRKRRWLAS